MSRAVAAHWVDARPAFVFGLLRWVVAALAGLAVVTLMGWWGEQLAKAVHDGPLGWLDRTVGAVIGLAFGIALAAIAVVLVVQVGSHGRVAKGAAHSVTARPLAACGIALTAWRGSPLPGTSWLHGQFVTTQHRLSLSRSS